MWCNACEEYSPCRSINPSDALGYDEAATGAVICGEDEQIKAFQRIRRCENCDEEFISRLIPLTQVALHVVF
jgi:hypothetical protein